MAGHCDFSPAYSPHGTTSESSFTPRKKLINKTYYLHFTESGLYIILSYPTLEGEKELVIVISCRGFLDNAAHSKRFCYVIICSDF